MTTALWQAAYVATLRRWRSNRSVDEIYDAVTQAYMKELQRRANGGEVFDDEKTSYWIHRRAVTYLNGKRVETMRDSRSVLNRSGPSMGGKNTDSRTPMDPGTWVENVSHIDTPNHGFTYQQGTSSQIEDGLIQAIDFNLKRETMATARDALELLRTARYRVTEMAIALGLTRAAVSRWVNNAAIPRKYQWLLYTLVEDATPLDEIREAREQAAKKPPSSARGTDP